MLLRSLDGTAYQRKVPATRMAVFGSEAIRRLGPVPVEGFRTVAKLSGSFEEEEAELSFLAGVLGGVHPANRFSTFLVIDQGSGSMEVVVGSLNAEGAKISAYKSYALGTRELVKMLQAAGTFDQLRKSLVVRFSRLKPFTHKVGGPPVVLGSAATRLAWMSVDRIRLPRTTLGKYRDVECASAISTP